MSNIIVRINNSTSTIENLTIEQHKSLSKALSYEPSPSARFFSGYKGTLLRSLLSKKGSFPTGLLYMVKTWLSFHKLIPELIIDNRHVPQPHQGIFKLSLTHPPYPEQIEACRAAQTHSRGIICAPTGFGKSIIIALIIDALQVPTLVVVPTLELKRQLIDSFKKMFKKGSSHITVENVDALALEPHTRAFDCVIIDEFHHSGAKTYRKLNEKAWGGIYYKFGLTATPFRSQDNEKILLESVLSKVIYEVDYQNCVDRGYIVPLEAYYFELPKQPVEGYMWGQVYNELVVNNDYRNQLISAVLRKFQADSLSALCLVKEIEHGNILSDLSGTLFAHGSDENTPGMISRFNSKALGCLIGTTGVMGEGVDTKPAEFIVIAGLGKSKNAFMQQCGRGFRTYPGKESCKIILFYDRSHKWTKSHFKAQCKILLDEYGVKPVKLEP